MRTRSADHKIYQNKFFLFECRQKPTYILLKRYSNIETKPSMQGVDAVDK